MVSVVITCYNYGKYLPGCIESVLAQSYQDFEIIIVNDGSTDDTEVKVAPYLDNRKIKYIYQDNQGQARAKNVGIAHSVGDFIAFLDADDLWHPEKLREQMTCFDDEDVGVVYCRASYLDELSKNVNYEMTSPYLQPRRGRVTPYLIFDNFLQFSSTVVRRDCLVQFGVFDETMKMGIDWDLWLRLSTAYSFDYVNDRLFSYRMGHAGQMSKNMEERHRCSDRIIEKFLSTYPRILPEKVIQEAHAFTCCNRGEYYRNISFVKSTGYFLDAIKISPLSKDPYKGLVKNILSRIGMYSS